MNDVTLHFLLHVYTLIGTFTYPPPYVDTLERGSGPLQARPSKTLRLQQPSMLLSPWNLGPPCQLAPSPTNAPRKFPHPVDGHGNFPVAADNNIGASVHSKSPGLMVRSLGVSRLATHIHQKLNGTLPTDPTKEVAIGLLDSQV